MKISSFLLLLFVLGCTNTDVEQVSGERIVSFSPSITATIVDIGGAELVVGRSAFCSSVEPTVPVVGDLYAVDYERLLRLQPTKVFVQKTEAAIDSHLVELAKQQHFSLHSWRCDRIDEIATMHDDLQQLLTIEGPSMTVLLKKVASAMPETILIMTPGSDGNAGLSFGKETYLDDLLHMMGGTNVLNDSGWVSLSLEDIARLNPGAILVVSDTPFEPSAALTSLEIPIKTFIHEDVLIPSSRIVDVAQAMQQELFSQ